LWIDVRDLTIPNKMAPLSKPITYSPSSASESGRHKILLPSPLLHLFSPACINVSFSKLNTPAFLPVSRFHRRIDFSPLLTLIMTLELGCIAKSFTPVDTSPGAAVSPLGLPTGTGIGALSVEMTLQSLFFDATAMVLSSAAERSFERDVNCSVVTVAAWCMREPSSRFLVF